jgi:hypothetical protein
VFLLLGLLAGCGSGNSTPATTGAAGTNGTSRALSAEATSAATGDIPDTQMFLVFSNRAAGYAIRYPEGWAQRGSGNDVTFQDKNNIVRIALGPGRPPTSATVSAELARLAAGNPTLKAGTPTSLALPAGPAIKVSYSTESAPNPVTGKRVTLIVDRYEIAHNGRLATIDLGTAKGVDNVDAYRMMIQSLRWV